jgi:hypothetical protein
VGCIYNLGVTTGTGPTSYSPKDLVTREQMAAFLARLFETLTGSDCAGAHPFTDIAASHWAYGPVGCIYNLGITNGTSPTSYSPGAPVTRRQMAAFLARLFEALENTDCTGTHPFTDIPTGDWSYGPVGCIYSLEVTTGTGPTSYSPLDLVTREQMAAFLARIYTSLT